MLIQATALISLFSTLSAVVSKTPDNVSSRLMIHVSYDVVDTLARGKVCKYSPVKKTPKSCNFAVQASTEATSTDFFRTNLDGWLPSSCKLVHQPHIEMYSDTLGEHSKEYW
jgi:hypothetical protein